MIIRAIYAVACLALILLMAVPFLPLDHKHQPKPATVTNQPSPPVAEVPEFSAQNIPPMPDILLKQPLFVRGRAAMAAREPVVAEDRKIRRQQATNLPALIGTLRRGDQFFAYFEGQGERSFRKGDRIAGWTIQDIGKRGVSLVRGSVSRQLLVRPLSAAKQEKPGAIGLGREQ